MTIFDMLVLDQIDSIMASYNSPMQSVAEDVEEELPEYQDTVLWFVNTDNV